MRWQLPLCVSCKAVAQEPFWVAQGVHAQQPLPSRPKQPCTLPRQRTCVHSHAAHFCEAPCRAQLPSSFWVAESDLQSLALYTTT